MTKKVYDYILEKLNELKGRVFEPAYKTAFIDSYFIEDVEFKGGEYNFVVFLNLTEAHEERWGKSRIMKKNVLDCLGDSELEIP